MIFIEEVSRNDNKYLVDIEKYFVNYLKNKGQRGIEFVLDFVQNIVQPSDIEMETLKVMMTEAEWQNMRYDILQQISDAAKNFDNNIHKNINTETDIQLQ